MKNARCGGSDGLGRSRGRRRCARSNRRLRSHHGCRRQRSRGDLGRGRCIDGNRRSRGRRRHGRGNWRLRSHHRCRRQRSRRNLRSGRRKRRSRGGNLRHDGRGLSCKRCGQRNLGGASAFILRRGNAGPCGHRHLESRCDRGRSYRIDGDRRRNSGRSGGRRNCCFGSGQRRGRRNSRCGFRSRG